MATLTLVEEDLSRAAVIARIKRGLESRSGKKWSVTGGTGTAYGWLTIDAPPARRTWREIPKPGVDPYRCYERANYEWVNTGQAGHMSSPDDRAELANLLGLESIHPQGQSIAAGHDYYLEYIDRAEGRPPRVIGTPYWD